MRSASYTSQFNRDVKLIEKRGKDMDKLRDVIKLILAGNPLPRELRDHPLKGVWRQCHDIHIEADWVLICRINGNEARFERTGTHADLFSR